MRVKPGNRMKGGEGSRFDSRRPVRGSSFSLWTPSQECAALLLGYFPFVATGRRGSAGSSTRKANLLRQRKCSCDCPGGVTPGGSRCSFPGIAVRLYIPYGSPTESLPFLVSPGWWRFPAQARLRPRHAGKEASPGIPESGKGSGFMLILNSVSLLLLPVVLATAFMLWVLWNWWKDENR